MEKVAESYFFNSDFETAIFSDSEFNPKLKSNFEFEYFILLLEKVPLYSPHKFDKDYLNFIRSEFNPAANYVNSYEKLIPWCAQYIDKNIISKETSALFNINELGFKDINIIHGPKKLKENYLYKRFASFGGLGNLKAPLLNKKIQNILENGEPLIEEPLRERTFDFSTLVCHDKTIRYQNIVDQHFHYKGTILKEFKLSDKLEEQYQNEIDKIVKYYQSLGISFPFSIDSFLYKEGKQIKLKTLSEVNARKSMGFVAHQLANKINQKHCVFLLTRDNFEISNYKKMYRLDPGNKMFKSGLFVFESAKDIDHSGLRLLESL